MHSLSYLLIIPLALCAVSMPTTRPNGSFQRLRRQLEKELEAELLKVTGVHYATSLGWTSGTGVWVLEGSKEHYDLLTNGTIDESLPWNERLKLAGAVFYDHWAEHPDIRDQMLYDGHTFTPRDIELAKAKRSVGEDASVDGNSSELETQSDAALADDSFPWLDSEGGAAEVKRSDASLADDSLPWLDSEGENSDK